MARLGRRSPLGRVDHSVVSNVGESVGQTPGDSPNAGRPAEEQHGSHHGRTGHIGLALATLGALGVVFGDIGTSPLYAFQTVFQLNNGRITPIRDHVLGVLSMTIWSILLVVSAKYVTFVMRADNDGEGGVLALAALVRRTLSERSRHAGLFLLLGVLGASLFYGDSLITPAISVLSAFEGLEVPFPSLSRLVVPLAAAVLLALFLAQRLGTSKVGAVFGPIMVIWFLAIAVTGIPEVARNPDVLRALSPSYGLLLAAHQPSLAFLALGGVVLAITGCEALYADMGHFGPVPIRRAWFALVLPALLCNYLGQGALVLRTPKAVSNPFFLLLPNWAQIPMVALAAFATVIASQAVISGAFSVSRQAVRLGYLPPLTIRQTSEDEGGQIYVPAVNALLLLGVLALLFTFQHSAKLATAYGIAVTGTLLITTVLFLSYARTAWNWSRFKIGGFAMVIGTLEFLFLAANLTKVASGGWLPLLVAAALFTVMTTWQAGRRTVTRRRMAIEGSLAEFLQSTLAGGIQRIPGTAIFPHPSRETVPLALRANVEHNRVLHEHVVIVTAEASQSPHASATGNVVVDLLGEGLHYVTVRYGFSDRLDLPAALSQAQQRGDLEGNADILGATYYISRATLRAGPRSMRPRWRATLFTVLAHNAADPAQVLRIPAEQTLTLGTVIEI